MSAPSQAQPGTAQQNPYAHLVRLEQLDKIPLPADKKNQIHTAVANHWNMIRSKPRESPEHLNAMNELARFTNVLQGLGQRPRTQGQQPQGATSSAAVGLSQVQANPQIPQTQGQVSTQAQQAQLQDQQQRPAQPQQAAAPKPDNAALQVSQSIRQHIMSFQFAYPVNSPKGTPEGDRWLDLTRKQYASILQLLEQAAAQAKLHENQEKAFAAQGKQPPPLFLQQKANNNTNYHNYKNKVDTFRQQQAKLREKQEQDNMNARTQNNMVPSASMVNNNSTTAPRNQAAGQAGQTPAINTSQSGGVVNPAVDAARNIAAARQSASPVSATQPQPHSAAGQAPTSFASQANHPNVQRPTMTTHQPGPGAVKQQSGTSNTAQPVPLTHGAAIDRSHSERSQATGLQPAQPAANQFTRSQSESQSQTKYPISKTLPPSVMQPPTPVSAGPSRPTMANGGASSQPIVAKQPTFTLEGDSKSRVLSKKKLDELVRQVTGSTDTLTPHAEETIMEMADEFVDNVVTAACRLAKLRNDSTLEIRDIQTVLERNYNIRIPGYSMDETRVVRRVNPAPGWNQKMNAINAAKVMNNSKTDA